LLCLGLATVINGGAIKGGHPGSFQQKIVEIINKGEFVEEVTTKPPQTMPVKVMPAGFDGEEPPETPEVIALGLPSWASLLIYPIDITFSCFGRPYGFYADIKNQCKIYHVCKPVTDAAGNVMRYLRYSFVCPNQTVFDQRGLVCTHAHLAVQCSTSHKYLYVNENFGKQNPGSLPTTSPITRPTTPTSGLRPIPLPFKPHPGSGPLSPNLTSSPSGTIPPECNSDGTGDSPIPCRYPAPSPDTANILVPTTSEAKPGSVIPAPGQVGPAPGPLVPAPGVVGPTPGVVVPAPGVAGPTPGVVVPAPSAAGPAPGAVVPSPGQVGPAPGSVVPAPGQVGPAPGPVVPVPGQVGPAPGLVVPAPSQVGPSPGPIIPAPGQVGPAPPHGQ
ncbi:basic proline-rich protein-like, partial [Limulus polyphemus]|uniref:Basic proline-rich protein-like n=1 Tax=Limulus polyphemus TaxID=6850 RepID=A0ABM1C3K3_LIMPO